MEIGDIDEYNDRMALVVICSAAPPEMVSTRTGHQTDGEVGQGRPTDAANRRRTSVEVNGTRLRHEYEMLSFRDDESVEAFALRLTDIVV